MKKITILLLSILLVSSLGIAQSQRMVLAEESTSSTCWPCGQQNPAFDALLKANSDIVTSVKYHVWWPAPGNDPMYLDNTEDNAARTNYYGINSVPRAVIDGNFFNGQPATVSQAMLQLAADEPTPFEIQMQHELSDDEDVIYVTTLVHATGEASGSLAAHTAVIEKHIAFATPPGSNGEKDFYNVMKKMLPNSNGADLPTEWEAGDYVILETSWVLENIYDMDELGAVGFIQDRVTKDVFQAANSSTDPLNPVYASDAELLHVLNVPSTNCNGMIAPVLEIRNNGSNELTSAEIEYSINGGETQTYSWTGSLNFLESEEVSLEEMTFDLMDENTFEANMVSINGSTDDFMNNNAYTFMINRAANVSGNLGLWLLLDDHPEETTWEIRNSNGDVMQSGGPYETSGQQFEPITVSASDCYEFIIFDAGGNGLDYYALVYGNQEIAFEGGEFGYMEKNQFGFDLVGIEEPAAYTDMQVYPNPASNVVNVNFYLPQSSDVRISVVDMVGKQVLTNDIGTEGFGLKQYQLNTSILQSGIYFIRVEVDNQTHVQKISIR
jgi:hypothetical protein